MSKAERFLLRFFTLSIPFGLPAAVFAQPRLNEAFDLIYPGILFFFNLGSVIAVTMIIMGGYMWMASGGNPERIVRAQGTLTWAIIGLIVLLTFRLALDPILTFFGVAIPI